MPQFSGLRHLLISREFPPAAYPPGGIGTYARHLSSMLARAGETVHVIGERWAGAPLEREVLLDGRLVVHRVKQDEPVVDKDGRPVDGSTPGILRMLAEAPPRHQRFAWQAALLAERIVEEERIDVIEAQEWEAPLSFFLLRRALGLGPARQPPCIVHLHSPTAFIEQHNEWRHDRWNRVPLMRLEEHCILGADALLCPSRFLARQAAERFGIDESAVRVIPYPAGDFPTLERPASVWRGGRVVYMGRLEPRKGLIEFVDAAVEVAKTQISAEFYFIGEDLDYRDGLTMRQYLERRIPRSLRRRFVFHPSQSRDMLPVFLADARAAVIPSRWDNLPNSCIEAMRSGLPVLASPEGGMAELVEDGVTGWLADTQTLTGLATALRRLLATPAEICEQMGRCAATSIRERLSDDDILRQHVEFRRQVANEGPSRSLRLHVAHGGAARERHSTLERKGIGIVVDASNAAGSRTALESIAGQRVLPEAVVVVNAAGDEPLRVREVSDATLKLATEPNIAGVAVVDARFRLAAEYVKAMMTMLERDDTLGIASCWVEHESAPFVRPNPVFPHQWMDNDVAGVAVYRSEALVEAGGFRPELPMLFARWDTANAILAADWNAVTWPQCLAAGPDPVLPSARTQHACEQLMRDRLHERWNRDAAGLHRLEIGPDDAFGYRVRDLLRMPLRKQMNLALSAVREPERLREWLRIRARRKQSPPFLPP